MLKNRLPPDGDAPKKDEKSLPVLHQLAIAALPDDLVQIIFTGLDAGKTPSEIDADIAVGQQRKLESN
ncbi:hypothetical protein A3C37_05075 [Candidatus Peribacteria bacterium RIFCSPHIGHO2_02_FULL_53_20]|nr:MAG: hypothetical protein A3C37_05075 [Candidatus Peribacteria bacterium RIFCSPHIGHO2_02_FULL_53_20]OGJ67355.1 MAG: hypothetical protein A3B61_03120 [Candidatus Peribacteria bacterium RIFCSPLOWO2_01_FULL_53_10]OGJ70083.1 MAG: hypothetical protein A3G69_02990 [Candidatus Peribacteria bacterium RIFCSPLOWO2_12_FULL_53_10]